MYSNIGLTTTTTTTDKSEIIASDDEERQSHCRVFLVVTKAYGKFW